MLKNNNYSIKDYVDKLPERYQPIFKHDELSENVSRKSEDRLDHIVNIYKVFEKKLDRPLRVLDLGCAQGFFSLSLAEIGASVVGIDLSDINIEVCNQLANEHPGFNVDFQVASIENIIATLQRDQYDIVLGLSVFHHIVYKEGIEFVQALLKALGDNVAIGIFEFALADEPMYWGVSQPKDSQQLLEGFLFIHELDRHNTHLSTITRPLYVVSNHYWCLNDQIGIFDSCTTNSHALVQGTWKGTRRYYMADKLIIKMIRLDHDVLGTSNLQEYNNEVVFLKNISPSSHFPKLLLYGQNQYEAWLVREKLPGDLLLDKILCDGQYDVNCVLHDVLNELAELESLGFYHNDLRPWNVLITAESHASLIDYGSIAKKQEDCEWPHNLFLTFLTFAYETITRKVNGSYPFRPIVISPGQFMQPYQKWITEFWSYPTSKWSFKLLFELFLQMSDDKKSDNLPEVTSLYLWMQSMEDAANRHTALIRHLQYQLDNSANIMVEIKDALNRINISMEKTVCQKVKRKLKKIFYLKDLFH